MQENGLLTSEHPQRSVRERFIRRGAILASGLALAAAGAKPAKAEITHEAKVPRAAQEFINQKAAFIEGLNCSGAVIDNDKGQAVGVLTAAHCGLRYTSDSNVAYHTSWIKGGDSRYYMQKWGMRLKTGDNMKSLITVGDIKQFILPTKDNINTDQALGVLAGHTAEEVLRAYKAEQLSQKEINTLVPGETQVYFAGWPVAQNGDGEGNMIRQQFSGTFFGQQVLTSAAGETLNVAWFAVERDSNGAVCSPGSSGSEGFILQKKSDGKIEVRSVGALSVGWDFGTYPDSKSAFEQKYGFIDWSKVDAVCGFATRSLATTKHEIVNVVHDVSEIPNPQVDSELAAQSLFFNSSYKPTVINGLVTEKNNTDDKPFIVDRPVIFANNDGSVVIGYYDEGNLKVRIFEKADELVFYPDDGSQMPSPTKTKCVMFKGAVEGVNQGSFVDDNGYEFGTFMESAKGAGSAGEYSLSLTKDGKIYFTLLNKRK